MKTYPHITKEIRNDIYIWAFQKIDGSMIRGEWNDKKGFYKFGTKTQLMDERTWFWGNAIALIKNKYEADLTKIFKEQKWTNVLCFFEYYGAASFAGNHNFQEPMDVILIDVDAIKQGILVPIKFIKLFEHLDIPKVCYEGYATTELFDQVKQSTLPGMSYEGVVAKGIDNKKKLIMFKIKSQAWLNKLKEHCKGNDQLFEKLC